MVYHSQANRARGASRRNEGGNSMPWDTIISSVTLRPGLASRGSNSTSAGEEAIHCPGSGGQIAASTPSAQPPLPRRVPTLSAQPCLPHSSHHGDPMDVLAMVRNHGRGPALTAVDRPDGAVRPADVDEQQERQPPLDMGARYTLGARTGKSSSSTSTSTNSGVPTPVLFDALAMVRDRSSELMPPPPPPLRSASAAAEDRPRGELLKRGERQPGSGVDAGACDTPGVPCGWRSGRGHALTDSAVQAPAGVGGSSRGCTRKPDKRATTAADCVVRDGGRAAADQSPSFDPMAMLRDRGSKPTPSPPPPLRSASTAVDRPRGGSLKRGLADVIDRQEMHPVSGADAGACDTSGVACGWRSGRSSALIDSRVPAPIGVGGSSRDSTRTPDGRAVTATDRSLQGGWGAVSDQSPSFDVMALVRNRGSEPMPPAPSPHPLSLAGHGFGGSGSADTARLQWHKNCYFCGRQLKRVRTEAGSLWVCGKKCGRWACGAKNCYSEIANCCSCDKNVVGCRCFNCVRKMRRALANRNGGSPPSRAANVVARRTVSWNSFVLSPTITEGGDSAPGSVHSVCRTSCDSRVLVEVNGEHATCTRDECKECKGVGPAVSSASEQKGNSTMEACEHAEAATKTHAQRPTSVRFLAEEDFLALATEAADMGVLGEHEVDPIMRMYRAACASGVPLAAKLGNTGYYVVRDGDDRSVPAGWAHVLYDREGGGGTATPNGGKTDDKGAEVVCKAYNGSPCFEAEGLRKVCLHTHIVALAVKALERGGASAGATSLDGDHRDDAIFASALREFESDRPSFGLKVSQLMKISAVYSFPPDPLPHLPRAGASIAERFTCFEKTCTRCGTLYEEKADQSAEAVTQGSTGGMIRRVRVEMRECLTCGAHAWASDNWRTTGMFNFNNKLLVDIRILVRARGFCSIGMPVEAFFEQLFHALKSNCDWLKEDPKLARRMSSRDLTKQLKECYFAFEATTDHAGDYSSILDGHFPRLQACDGGNRLETDNAHVDFLLQAQQEEVKVIDMDLGAQQLKLSMMTPMVFGTRFQFVATAPVNFSPHNRKSNILRVGARGATPIPGPVESGDGAGVVDYLREAGKGTQALDDMITAELEHIYVRCFGSRIGLDKYPTKALLVELLKKLRANYVVHAGGSEECPVVLSGRGAVATSGLGGFYTPDGVQNAHMFFWRAQGPKYVVEMVNHFLVPPIVLVTDAPCMVRPIMHQRCRHLLENGGVLPRVGPEHETNNTGDSAGTATGLDGMPNTPPLELGAVSIPALANMGANAHPISGCEPMLEAIDLQRDEAVADVYDLFRRASASVPVQRGVDFFCLLDAAAENSPGDGWAVELRNTVVNSWELMHEIGYYFLSLYEAALVQMECCRLTATRLKALQDNPDTSRSSGGGGVRGHGVEWGRKMSDPCTGATRGIGGEGGSGGGRRGGSGSKMLHWRDAERRGEFLRKVLATAAGATKLSGAPTLPGFFSFRGLVPDEPDGAIGGLDALIRYGEAKVTFIADGLKPENGRLKEKAVHFLRIGAGFGTPVHAVKSLQIALSGCNPGKSANEEGLVEGYGLPFNIKPPEADQVRELHRVVGKLSGLHLSADDRYRPHEAKKHGPKCRAMFGGLETCEELAGVNLNPHKQNRAEKESYLRSLNMLGCDSFAFMVTLGNELENQSINRRSLDRLVEKKQANDYRPKLHNESCKGRLWSCGRCFCVTPVMRSFDRFGRVSVAFLDKQLEL